MLTFFKNWKIKKELKKLYKIIKESEKLQENLLNNSDKIEQFANRRIKELELKIEQIEQQLTIFERVIDSLDPRKRLN
jgi:DNA repair exonuclease SbcCD ATPase subunit